MRRLPGWVTRNWRLKVGCAILAMITWVGVVYAGNPPETRAIAVHVPQDPSSIPAGFVLVRPVPDITSTSCLSPRARASRTVTSPAPVDTATDPSTGPISTLPPNRAI